MIYPGQAKGPEPTQSQGLITTNSFSIAANEKSFELLTSRLYKAPIRAIVRELACNAWDSHVMSAQGDRPFNVMLPTHGAPTFVVEDFGLGLDHNDVMHLYTTCFESNKNRSNDPVGAHGLGSKTPFSLVDVFTVVSTFEGKRRIYSAYRENRLPKISLMSEEDKDAPNGLRVEITVPPRYFAEFHQEARRVLKYITPSDIDGGSATPVEYVQFRKDANGKLLWGIRAGKNNDAGTAMQAIQGPVAYPLALPYEHRKGNTYAVLENLGLDIYFPIGTLDVTLSREELHYEPTTIKNINTRIDEVLKQIVEDGKALISAGKNAWEMNTIYNELTDRLPYKGMVGMIAGKFGPNNDIEVSSTFGKVSYEAKDVEAWPFGLNDFSWHHTSRKGKHVKRHTFAPRYAKDSFAYVCDKHTIFLYDDTKNIGGAMVEHYMAANPLIKHAYLFRPHHQADRLNSDRLKVGFDKAVEMLKEVSADGLLVKLSTLDVTLPERARVQQEQMTTVFKLNPDYYNTKWSLEKVEWGKIDTTVKKYYFPMSHHQIILPDRETHADNLGGVLNQCINLEILPKGVAVYGIQKTKRHLLDASWIDITVELPKMLLAIPLEKHEEWQLGLAIAGIKEDYRNWFKRAGTRLHKFDKDSYFRTCVEFYKANEKAKGRTIKDSFDFFKLDLPKVKINLPSDFESKLLKNYPMLAQAFRGYYETRNDTMLEEYIRVMDAEKTRKSIRKLIERSSRFRDFSFKLGVIQKKQKSA
jgi:hypothetical protein